MGTIDNHYEAGMDKVVFPPFPFFVPYLVKHWYERRYAGSWRFSHCNGWGSPRPLIIPGVGSLLL